MDGLFQLYVRHDQGPGRVQVVTCREEQVVSRARELLERSDGREVDVLAGGQHVFTLVR